jgi:D-alanyl-D-alanine carboxypeptidase/D-alanyl-D-alanine-endopeptidase (penicillin-binding protein 4)
LPRRFGAALVALVAFATIVAASPAAGASLQTRLGRALNASGVPSSSTSVIALNLQTGKVVFQRNPDLALLPASNEKLAVTLAALEELGPRFRIPTRIYGEGHQDGDVWRGRLVIKGYGDPTLARDDLRKLAREIRSRGIRFVTGGVVADESFFDTRRMAPGWKPSYFKEECPPLSALVVGRGERGDGFIADDPALMTAKAFRTALEGAGIRVVRGVAKAAVKPTAARLADVFSPTVMVIVKLMNLESDNFLAEMLLKEVGAQSGTRGSSAAGAVVVRRVLKDRGVPLAGVRIKDGSGLSRLDRWTARGLGALLRSAWSDTRISGIFLASLPVAGISGTLADRMEHAPARAAVRAKTGTTSAASALSGFVKQTFVFSILQNGSPVPTTGARRSQDRFAQVLAGAAG